MAALKELALNPIALASMLAILLVYSLLIFEIIASKTALKQLDKPITTLIFIGTLPVAILPFSLALPQRLCLANLSFTGALTTLVIWVPIVFFMKRISFPKLPQDLTTLLKDPFLALLCLMAIASTFWSQTPDITLRSSLSLAIIALLATHFSKKYSWEELEAFLRHGLLLVGIISLIITVFLPSLQPFGQGGLVSNGATFGSLMALNTALWTANALYRKGLSNRMVSILIVIVSLFSIAIYSGKSALITTIMLLYLILILRLIRSIKFRQSIFLVMTIILVSCFLGYAINTGIDAIFQALGKDPTLTGRTVFWAQLVEEISKHPIGFGYNGFWQPWRGTEDPAALIGSGSAQLGTYRPPHAHNGFLEIGLQLGYVGLLLYFISFLRSLALAVWHQQLFRGAEAITPLILLTFLIISNLTETQYLGLIGPNQTLFFYILSATKLSSKNKTLSYKT